MKRLSLIYVVAVSVVIPRAFAQYTTSIVAGGGPSDGASALSVALADVEGIAADTSGNVFIVSGAQNRVFKVAPDGILTTVAGNGTVGFSGDNGPGKSAQLTIPFGVAVDGAGNVYIGDSTPFGYIGFGSNSRIRKVSSGVITTVAGNGSNGYSGDGGAATSAMIGSVTSVAAHGTGNLYIGDGLRVRKISSGIITTVAGNGFYGYSGDGGSATSAEIGGVGGLAADSGGNLYIADSTCRIRKVSGGIISTVVGNGVCGYSGDGGPAASAQTSPRAVAVDHSGNLYIADGCRIRLVSGGIISTVVGNGTCGYLGDGGPATSAEIGNASGVAVDGSGSIYIANTSDSFSGGARIRKVSAGVISTIAGNGTWEYSGDGGPATSGQLSPTALAANTGGDLYISDAQDSRIRKVSGGVISTAAGTGSSGYSGDGGPATSAQIGSFPGGIAVDSAGSLYISDSSNSRVRKVSGGVISTIAGNGTFGYSGDGGPATSAELLSPGPIAADNSGDVYLANFDRVRKISGGIITTIAGGGPPNGVSATAVSINPSGTAVDSLGNIYIADSGHHRVFEVSTSGSLSVLAGNGTPGFSGDGGPAASAQLVSPNGVAVDSAGNVFIADTGNARVRKVSGGIISTVAGGGGGCPQEANGVGDGCPATNASLSSPNAIAVDSTGSLYIADSFNWRIRKVSAGVIATVAGNGTMGFSGDGGPATSAQIGYSLGVAVDSAGNLYLVDNYTRIRKVSSGVITTVAGNGTGGYSGDGVPATSAEISPWGVAVDVGANLYIADFSNNRVRKVSGGIITTVAGNGTYGYSGDGGPATSAQIGFATSVAVDSTGNLYIGDGGNYRIRKVAGGIISTIAGNGLYSSSGDGGPATEAQLSYVSGLASDAAGNVYISDPGSGRVRVVSPAGTISTFAGGGTSSADGIPATSATLTPGPLAAAGGNLYVRDTSSRVLRKVSSGIITTITTIAGQGSYPFPGGGGVAVDSAGRIYVSDVPDSHVRALTPGSGGTVPVSITSSPAGVSITVTGPGCAPGTYTTPAKLTWASRTSCTVKFGDPQIIGGVSYAFRSSTVNGSATSHRNPRTINSGTSALKISATYSSPGGGKCDDGTGGDDGGKCGDGTGGDDDGQGGDSTGGDPGEH